MADELEEGALTAEDIRRARWRRAKRMQRARETAEQRNARLAANRERNRARRAADPEAARRENAAAMRVWRAAHPEERRAAHAAYRARNRLTFRRYWSERKHRRRGCRDVEAHRDYSAVVLADPCVYCGRATEQVDHIVALVRGGEDEWTNLTGACQVCNSRKWAAPLLLFLLGEARG